MEVVAPHRRIRLDDDSAVAEARRAAVGIAQGLRFDETRVGGLAIVVTELGSNIRKHGADGCMLVGLLPECAGGGVEVLAVDRGPGMADVERCMRDGVSSAGTRGAGLGAVRRLSDVFDLYAAPGRGVVAMARFHRTPPRPGPAVVGGISISHPQEQECGDSWGLQVHDDGVRIVVVDGLGHGPMAASAARAATDAIPPAPASVTPEDWLRFMHAGARGSRGAAATVAFCDPGAGTVAVAGVGNVVCRVIGAAASHSAVSMYGTLGQGSPRFRTYAYGWGDELVILHSDGISQRWGNEALQGLFGHHPSIIAAALWRDQQRGRDDATIVVSRRNP